MRREPKADRAYVRRVCHDVLQRGPGPREARTYVGAAVLDVARHLVRSAEAMRQWLEEELFYFLLLDNFRPRTQTIESIPERLRRDRITVHDAIAEILLSTGFTLRNPGNDTFVTVVLEQCLGLEVQERRVRPMLEAGKQMYDGKKARLFGTFGRSQSDVVKIVRAQERFTQHLLDRHHARLFGEPLVPPTGSERRRKVPAGAQSTIDRLHGDHSQFFPILTEWLSSRRYLAGLRVKKPRNDRQFVRSLYTDLLEREPTHDELRNMRNALQSMADSSPLRAVMAKVILDSGEARLPGYERGREAEFVTACFWRYLGRRPTQSEAADFAAVLREPDAEPRHVVRALLGTPEYQFY